MVVCHHFGGDGYELADIELPRKGRGNHYTTSTELTFTFFPLLLLTTIVLFASFGDISVRYPYWSLFVSPHGPGRAEAPAGLVGVLGSGLVICSLEQRRDLIFFFFWKGRWDMNIGLDRRVHCILDALDGRG